MRRFLPEEVRNEIIEHLTDTEKKELGQIPYVMGVLLGFFLGPHFPLLVYFWPDYGGLTFVVLATCYFLIMIMVIWLLSGYGWTRWMLHTKYGKSLDIRSPELR